MAVDTIPNTIKFSTLLGASALVGGATCILLGKPLLYVGSKVNAFIDHAMPTLKGPLNAALVITPINLVAVPLTKYALSKKSDSRHEMDHHVLSTLAGAATIFFSTTFLAPKLSRLISTYQVSYLSAALYGLAGGAAFAHQALETEGFFSREENQVLRLKHRLKEYEGTEHARHIPELRDQISEIEARTSYPELALNNIKSSLWNGTFALLGGAAGLLAFNLTLTVHGIFQSHAAPFFKNVFEAVKGPGNAALVSGAASLVAIPLSKYTFSKVGFSLHEKDHRVVSYLSGMAAIILSTTLITPKLSPLISTHQVSYLSAAFYGLAGAGVFALGASQTNGFRSDTESRIIELQERVKEERASGHLSGILSEAKAALAHSSYSESLMNTATHSLTSGAYTLAAGAAGLLVYKLALATSSIFQTHATPFLKSSVQAIKGPGNATLVITGASLAAIPLRDYINRKIRKSKLHREDKAMLTTTSGVATIFLATALFTPKLSSYISSHQVSYLGASLYGLAGGLAFTQKDAVLGSLFEE